MNLEPILIITGAFIGSAITLLIQVIFRTTKEKE